MGAIPLYRGRFAPSPTGPLHAGSLVAALASWLDARSHRGHWLVRIEDVDTPRCIPGMDKVILQQLAACGLQSDEPPIWQSQRTALYQAALERLLDQGLAYPCSCSRNDIEAVLRQAGVKRDRHQELVYPGTCRSGLQGRAAHAWRIHTGKYIEKVTANHVGRAGAAIEHIAESALHLQWTDRRLGPQQQHVAREVGDFVVLRADGLFAYQLAVVVDDAAQGITHVVRGEDLTDNTARQILLQRYLHLAQPAYLHTPLVRGSNGEKLSKQNGAQTIDTATPASASAALNQAAKVLGLPAFDNGPTAGALTRWTALWAGRYPTTCGSG